MELFFLAAACLIGYGIGRADKWQVQVQLRGLTRIFNDAVKKLRDDGVLLPSLVRWADALEEARDEAIAMTLRTKKRPAVKGADEVSAARAEKRAARREMQIALNRVDLYESLAPWLNEFTELSVAELIEAVRDEQEAKESAERGEDPVSLYVPKSEWKKLAPRKRNQLALDRYCDTSRRRTPWAAGIQYERYVGYTYEKLGYAVAYHGALQGKEDQGIDLICEEDDSVLVVQCKRLSKEKAIPVRENVVAQIFGSAEFHKMESGTKKSVRPVLITTYELSEGAKRFAEHLSVEVRENFALDTYPMIKCNISQIGGEKIYHLPMDQQYDNVIIGDRKGEFYAQTVAEAEKKGFRRAFRWHGDR